jgi:hypothetical protein
MSSIKQCLIALAAMSAVLAGTQGAFAQNILAHIVRVGNYDNTATTATAVPLDASSDTSLSFTTTKANEVVRIIYNAECAVLGDAEAYLSITVMVDGKEARPASGTSFAFCTAVSTTSYAWAGAVRQSIFTVPAVGVHSVQIIAQSENDVTEWWLGDSSLVIDH